MAGLTRGPVINPPPPAPPKARTEVFLESHLDTH